MKDRYLYRAWHIKRKKYYKVLHLHLGSPEGIWATCEGFDVIDDKKINIDIQPGEGIYEQCLGQEDKCAALIYEGDVVKEGSSNRMKIVYWQKDGAQFRIGRHGNKTQYDKSMGILCASWLTVVGNIRENPELMEETSCIKTA